VDVVLIGPEPGELLVRCGVAGNRHATVGSLPAGDVPVLDSEMTAEDRMMMSRDVTRAVDVRGRSEGLVGQHAALSQLESKGLRDLEPRLDADGDEREVDLFTSSIAELHAGGPTVGRQPAHD